MVPLASNVYRDICLLGGGREGKSGASGSGFDWVGPVDPDGLHGGDSNILPWYRKGAPEDTQSTQLEETPDNRNRATSRWTDDPEGGGGIWGEEWGGVASCVVG